MAKIRFASIEDCRYVNLSAVLQKTHRIRFVRVCTHKHHLIISARIVHTCNGTLIVQAFWA